MSVFTHRRSLISELCVFLVSVGHFVHDGRHNLSLFANKEDGGGKHLTFNLKRRPCFHFSHT